MTDNQKFSKLTRHHNRVVTTPSPFQCIINDHSTSNTFLHPTPPFSDEVRPVALFKSTPESPANDKHRCTFFTPSATNHIPF